MKEKLKKILENMHKHNSMNMAYLNFGLDVHEVYDALVIAPGWKPTRIITDPLYKITTLTQHAYISGYLVEKEGYKIAWIQIASGASNLIDHLTICAELQFKKLIFVGAVGSLSENFNVGDLCTPTYSISGVYANAYLESKLSDYTLFSKVEPKEEFIRKVIDVARGSGYEIKKGSVFCTDSIALEYSHLDEIYKFEVDLIEMETSSFYLMADLLDVPAIALLIVSDNLKTYHPLVGRNVDLQSKYDLGRKTMIPDLIYQIIKKIPS